VEFSLFGNLLALFSSYGKVVIATKPLPMSKWYINVNRKSTFRIAHLQQNFNNIVICSDIMYYKHKTKQQNLTILYDP